MLLGASLLNTQYCKVRIKSKGEQIKERCSTLPLHLGVVANVKGAFGGALNYGCQRYIILYVYIKRKIEKQSNRK